MHLDFGFKGSLLLNLFSFIEMDQADLSNPGVFFFPLFKGRKKFTS